MKLSMNTLDTFLLLPHLYYEDIPCSRFLSKQHNPRRLLHLSSLRGSVESVLTIDSANHCCIPEAISLHQVTDENFSTFIKPRHRKVRARRLLRHSSTSKEAVSFVWWYFISTTLLAMTSKRAIVGCVLRTSTVSIGTNYVYVNGCGGALRAPYTFLKGASC
jgi:hypothetical protein